MPKPTKPPPHPHPTGPKNPTPSPTAALVTLAQLKRARFADVKVIADGDCPERCSTPHFYIDVE